MAAVTMELRNVLLMNDFKLFDFEYQCDDLNFKQFIENQFVSNYYFHEIGQETIDRWKHRVKTKFETIMPYYNELHNSTLLSLDPLITHRRTETLEETANDTGSNNLDVTNEGSDKTFEHPQNDNPLTDIATGSGVSSSTGNQSATNITDRVRNYQKIIEGLDGDQSVLLENYRKNMLRINQMILKECKDLFILVY